MKNTGFKDKNGLEVFDQDMMKDFKGKKWIVEWCPHIEHNHWHLRVLDHAGFFDGSFIPSFELNKPCILKKG